MTRPTARQRGYDSKWDRARAAFLTAHPWCRRCEAQGKLHRATVVDHIEPHRGDYKLFWSRSNWQPLCQPCHDQDKQQVERRGYAARVDASGRPTDPQHPFNRGSDEEHDQQPASSRSSEDVAGAPQCDRGASKVAGTGPRGPAWTHRAELVSGRGLCGRAR
ncbi:HNH endonuclease signature motif containing protein [Jiella sp. M17.18]|uniref:HNH endonuclease signature motif containing protein n=1 Tax=Jiella sp. M17.18 TaxID=3234247 RepID=UPI0034DE0016